MYNIGLTPDYIFIAALIAASTPDCFRISLILTLASADRRRMAAR
jgi:hypothetical protein